MSDALIQIEDMAVDFVASRHIWGTPKQYLRAVNGVHLEVYPGETLGLVGESGSGKSTLARGLMGLVKLASGRVYFDGQDVSDLTSREFRRVLRDMQMIFQDPYSSLDPSMAVEDIISEPLAIHGLGGSRKERGDRVSDALRQVDLQDFHRFRYPFEFSGGQRQRIAIARALVLEPRLIICDEAVSALDVSTQSNIINLLKSLQDEMGIAYLFIAHDLEVVRAISDRTAVMYLGEIVEQGPSERVGLQPAHPYTEALLSAIPQPYPSRRHQRERIRLDGEIPSPLDPPSGCRFHTRCPYVMDMCRTEVPKPTPVQDGGNVACHLHTEGPRLQGASVLNLSPTWNSQNTPT